MLCRGAVEGFKDSSEKYLMISVSEFRENLVDQAISQFAANPDNMMHACSLIWCIDAFASHVALERFNQQGTAEQTSPSVVERNFKKALIGRSWQFHILKEVSNALKHGERSRFAFGATSSNILRIEEIVGFLWWSHGPQKAPYWGEQIICDLEIVFNKEASYFFDTQGARYEGPFVRWVPIIGLIEPSMEALGYPIQIKHLLPNYVWE